MVGAGLTEGQPILWGIDWTVHRHERWVILGPNGSGKTSLLRLAAGTRLPSRGSVELLGSRLGRVNLRELRRHIGYASQALARALRPQLTVVDAVITARHAALEPWWHAYSTADRERAHDLLRQVGCEHLSDREFGTISDGERQRVLIARLLMPEPELLLLDEPTAGLDFSGRELLLHELDRIASDPETPAIVLVTHRFEEIPRSATHALLLREGTIVAAGPIEAVLNSERASSCFALPITIARAGGRWVGAATTEDCLGAAKHPR